MKIIRTFLPLSIRHFLWTLIPKVSHVNTLVLENIQPISKKIEIPSRYEFIQVTNNDINKLKEFYEKLGSSAYRRKVPKRLNSKSCKGFGFLDISTGKIVYMNWINHEFTSFLNDFNIEVKIPMVFWESSYCDPGHRHQGLHERMEQELINYAIENGVKYFYMQIHTESAKGNIYAQRKGYKHLNTRKIISWPFFNIFRDYSSFKKTPFKKIAY